MNGTMLSQIIGSFLPNVAKNLVKSQQMASSIEFVEFVLTKVRSIKILFYLSIVKSLLGSFTLKCHFTRLSLAESYKDIIVLPISP